MGMLVIEGDSSLTLSFGDATMLSARYTESGAPVAGTTIRFALEGRAHDATLSEVMMVTDADGRVTTTLTGGSAPSVFRVRASSDRAAPAYVNVSVGNMGFGGLRVGASYAGSHDGATRRVIDVYSEMSCADDLPTSPDRTQALDNPDDVEADFPVLAAGLHYAVRGRVLGASGVPLATACVDGVEVLRDMEVRVDLTFSDQPLVVDGDYDTSLGLRSTSTTAFLAELARGTGAARLDMAGTAAALYLDALEDQLRTLGDGAAADALAARRLDGMTDATLQGRLDDAGAGPTAGLNSFVTLLASRLSMITLAGPLALGTTSGTLEGAFGTLTLKLGLVGDPESVPLEIDAAAIGLSLAPTATWSFTPGDATLGLDSLTLTLPLGTLADAAIDAEAHAHGYDSAAKLLVSGAGCDVLASWITEDPVLAPLCDSDCAAVTCTHALEGVLNAVRGALAATDETHSEASLSGSVSLVDTDADLVVDRLVGNDLAGAWSDGTSTGDPLDGQLTGMR